MKLTVIGGGSATFVPTLVRQLIGSDTLRDVELVLMDVDEGRLGAMERLTRALTAGAGSDIRVRATTDRRAALTDADFVVTTIAVGGSDAWEKDIEIPARYGIFMFVGDSVGPGGIMRGLRNLPVLEAVAAEVAELAPDALVFNYANPASPAVMVMADALGDRVVSLCSCTWLPANAGWLAWTVGAEPADILRPVVVGGINHCAAITELRLADGRDGLALAREHAQEPFVRSILESYGVLPYCWTHWTEFLPDTQALDEPYAGRAQGLRVRHGMTIHDMEEARSRTRDLEERVSRANGALTLDQLPAGAEDLGIEIVAILEAVTENRGAIHVVNAVNRGLIPNLPADAVVEVNARVDAYGVRPIRTRPLPDHLAAHLSRFVEMQRAMVRAARSGTRDDALEAFRLEPTIAAKLTSDQARALLDEMWAAHASG